MTATYAFRQKVLFKHCDPAGIVFFPRYFEMINDCVEHFFDDFLKWPFEELLKTVKLPTAQISTQFRAPSRHGDQLVLTLTVVRLGHSSLTYAILARCGDETRFEAEGTLVHVDESGKASGWPEKITKKLNEET